VLSLLSPTSSREVFCGRHRDRKVGRSTRIKKKKWWTQTFLSIQHHHAKLRRREIENKNRKSIMKRAASSATKRDKMTKRRRRGKVPFQPRCTGKNKKTFFFFCVWRGAVKRAKENERRGSATGLTHLERKNKRQSNEPPPPQ
jgi:hypothetical protein